MRDRSLLFATSLPRFRADALVRFHPPALIWGGAPTLLRLCSPALAIGAIAALPACGVAGQGGEMTQITETTIVTEFVPPPPVPALPQASTTSGADAFAAAVPDIDATDVGLFTHIPIGYLPNSGDDSAWVLVGGSGSYVPQFDVSIAQNMLISDESNPDAIQRVGPALILTQNMDNIPAVTTRDLRLYSVEITGLGDETISAIYIGEDRVPLIGELESKNDEPQQGITLSVDPITELYTESEIQQGTAAGLWFSPEAVWANPESLPIGFWNGQELRVLIGNSGSWTPQFELRSGLDVIAPRLSGEAAIQIETGSQLTLVEIGDIPAIETADLSLYEIRIMGLADAGFNGGAPIYLQRENQAEPQLIAVKSVRSLR